MADGVFESTPTQFAQMFRNDPRALVRVLREFWDEVERTLIIERHLPSTRVDFICDSSECKENALRMKGALVRVRDGLESAAGHSAALRKIPTSYLDDIEGMADVFGRCYHNDGMATTTARWFADTIDLIELS